MLLDIGTNTGSKLHMLSDLGFRHVTGVDISDDAIRFCAGKDLGRVEKGNVCS
jgi:SAM-dependent methyltransferase